MKSAGWSPSSGISKENQASFQTEGEASGELEQAEIPDWLKAMAPAEELEKHLWMVNRKIWPF